MRRPCGLVFQLACTCRAVLCCAASTTPRATARVASRTSDKEAQWPRRRAALGGRVRCCGSADARCGREHHLLCTCIVDTLHCTPLFSAQQARVAQRRLSTQEACRVASQVHAMVLYCLPRGHDKVRTGVCLQRLVAEIASAQVVLAPDHTTEIRHNTRWSQNGTHTDECVVL